MKESTMSGENTPNNKTVVMTAFEAALSPSAQQQAIAEGQDLKAKLDESMNTYGKKSTPPQSTPS